MNIRHLYFRNIYTNSKLSISEHKGASEVILNFRAPIHSCTSMYMYDKQ